MRIVRLPEAADQLVIWFSLALCAVVVAVSPLSTLPAPPKTHPLQQLGICIEARKLQTNVVLTMCNNL